MAGSTFYPGEQKIRPGVFIRITNVGEPQIPGIIQGVAAAAFQADWGPLGSVQLLESVQAGRNMFRSGEIATFEEAFRGGAKTVYGYRLGTGGTKPSFTIQNTEEPAADAVTVSGKYVGTINLSISIGVDPNDATKKLLKVYEDGIQREQHIITAGAGEATRLVAALTADSQWLEGVVEATAGDGILEDLNNEALAGGANPAIVDTDYDTAMDALEPYDWTELAVDSEVVTVHAKVKTFIDRVRAEGKRARATIGEPTSVAYATRLAHAAAFNDPAIKYVANGFKLSDGTEIEGYKAAARIAGMSAAANITDSLTHTVVNGAVEIIDALTNGEIEQAIQNGAMAFTVNAAGQVHIEYDINTLVTLAADQDAGWKKNRRVRTRDTLVGRVVAAWDVLVGKVTNNADGRSILIGAAQGVIDDMIELNALESGSIIEDPGTPPSGDESHYVLEVIDNDSAEKLYIACGFQF